MLICYFSLSVATIGSRLLRIEKLTPAGLDQYVGAQLETRRPRAAHS